jgi:hypothetical protein
METALVPPLVGTIRRLSASHRAGSGKWQRNGELISAIGPVVNGTLSASQEQRPDQINRSTR